MKRLDFEVNEIIRIARNGTNMDEEYLRILIRLKCESLLKNGFGEGFIYCANHCEGNAIIPYAEAVNDFIENY